MSLAAAALVAGIGVLIGNVGLGGFLMVPVLVHLQGATVREGLVVAALAFLASGLVSLALWRRRPAFALRPLRGFLVACLPGAMLGASVVEATVDDVLAAVIAAAFALAGIAEWCGFPREAPARAPTLAASTGGGLAAGFGSALTGTSGPMVAMPLLASIGMPLSQRVTVAQIAQIPIALGATLGFVTLADVPWRLAGFATLALCVGLVAGHFVSRRIRVSWLRRTAAMLMLAAAASMLATAHG